MNNRVIFSRNSDEWSTPQHIYDALNEEFHFTLDACATDENHKHERYYTKEQDALQMDWGGRQCSATLPTRRSGHGQKSPIVKGSKTTQQWYC